MSDSPLQPEAPIGDPVLDPALARAERRLARLEELADLAMELARAAQRRALDIQAMAPGLESGRRPARDAIADFDRSARIVRLTSGLQARLEEDLKTVRREAETRAEARAQAAKAARTPLQVRKDDLRDCVADAIEAETDGREARLLYAELNERLDREDGEARLLDRPLGAVIAEICTELGLEPDWSLWEEEDWAIEETRKGAEGSPYAAGDYRWEPPDGDADLSTEAAEDSRIRQEVLASLGP